MNRSGVVRDKTLKNKTSENDIATVGETVKRKRARSKSDAALLDAAKKVKIEEKKVTDKSKKMETKEISKRPAALDVAKKTKAAPTVLKTVGKTKPEAFARTKPATVSKTIAATVGKTEPVIGSKTRAASVANTKSVTVAKTKRATVTKTKPATVSKTKLVTASKTKQATVPKTKPVTASKTKPVTVAKTKKVDKKPKKVSTGKSKTVWLWGPAKLNKDGKPRKTSRYRGGGKCVWVCKKPTINKANQK